MFCRSNTKSSFDWFNHQLMDHGSMGHRYWRRKNRAVDETWQWVSGSRVMSQMGPHMDGLRNPRDPSMCWPIWLTTRDPLTHCQLRSTAGFLRRVDLSKKLRYRRGTARRSVQVETLPTASYITVRKSYLKRPRSDYYNNNNNNINNNNNGAWNYIRTNSFQWR